MTSMFRTLACALGLILLPMLAAAQNPAPRLDVESMRQELGQIEAQLQRQTQADSELLRLRARLEPIIIETQAIIARQMPRLDDINARLSQIGPRPDAKAPAESAEVIRTREEQETAKKEVDEVVRVARLLQVRAEQMQSTLTDRRRALFKQAILERSQGIASPWLWSDVVRAIPGAVDSLSASFRFRARHVLNTLDNGRIIAALTLLIVAGILAVLAGRVLRRWQTSPPEDHAPTRAERALGALRQATLPAIIPLVLALVIFAVLDILDLSADRFGELARTIALAIPLLIFTRGLSTGFMSPEAPAWRLLPLENDTATRLSRMFNAILIVVVGGKLIEAANLSISAALPFTVAAKGLAAFLSGSMILWTLRALEAAPDPAHGQDDTEILPGSDSSWGLVARLGGWTVGALTVVTALIGYVAFASFLIDQVLWVLVVGAVLGLFLVLIDAYLLQGLAEDSRLGRQVRGATGLSAGSVQQIGILSSGLIRLVLYAAATLLVLAPFGVDSGDMVGSLRAAFFGFQLGGVTVSLSTIAIAVFLFFLAFFITRSVQRWLEGTYLPSTSLDVGLQNSIITVFGYVGFMAAAIFSMGYLGLSLDKITIVAGALSVGIGLGLQSIVNNFVSGLILLWERPIRVGDWIAVGEEHGKVKRINVRATEIETFDKASLIVPNSEFISGRVKNFMHSNRMARINIPIGVSYGADPEAVRKLLLDVALAHMEVLSNPPPVVFFMKLGESSLDFELRCFVDVDATATTRSELMFAIFAALKKQEIDIPFPRRTVEIADMDGLGRAIASHMPQEGKP